MSLRPVDTTQKRMAPLLGLLVIAQVLCYDHISTNAPPPAVKPSQKVIATDKTNTTTSTINSKTVYNCNRKKIIEIDVHH